MATLFLLVKIRLTEHGWHLWHNAHFQMASAISLLPPWLHVFIQCDLGIVYPEVTFISSSLESGCVWHPGKYDSVSVPGIGLHWPGSFYSSLWEPSHCAGRCPNHMERPHAGNPVYTTAELPVHSSCQLPAMWVSPIGGPSPPELQLSVNSTWSRGSTQLCPVSSQNHEPKKMTAVLSH